MNPYTILGISLIIGIFFAILSERIKMPSVAGYIIAGIIFGQILNIFKINVMSELDIFSTVALGFIAFIVGGELKIKNIRHLGASIMWIVLFETTTAFILVTAVTMLLTNNFALSLILGAVSAATAPAATVMVVEQYRTKGDLTTTLLAVVGLDDGAALIIYSFAIAIAKVIVVPGAQLSFFTIVVHPLWEIIGSLILGAIFGWLYGYYIRHRHGSRMEFVSMATGIVFLIIGVDRFFHFSGILSNMAFGFVLTNYAPHNSNRVFRGIKEITPSIYILFFVLAGTKLDITLLPSIGLLGAAYLVFRIVGKVSGASLGAVIGKAPDVVKRYIGYGLLSQVGIAIGLAVVIFHQLSDFGKVGYQMANIVINILLVTTIFTEVLGPSMLKYAFTKADEIGKA